MDELVWTVAVWDIRDVRSVEAGADSEQIAFLLTAPDEATARARACYRAASEPWSVPGPQVSTCFVGTYADLEEYDENLTGFAWPVCEIAELIEAETKVRVEVVAVVDSDGNPSVVVFVNGQEDTAAVVEIIDPGASGPYSTRRWRQLKVQAVGVLSPAAGAYAARVYEGFEDTRWVRDDVDDDEDDIWDPAEKWAWFKLRKMEAERKGDPDPFPGVDLDELAAQIPEDDGEPDGDVSVGEGDESWEPGG